MLVKQIDSLDTFKLRKQILRPNGEDKECYFEGDSDENTFHLGAYIEGELVSIASFYMNNCPKFKEDFQYQLRGMATLAEHRNKGLSKALLKTAFPMIKNNHIYKLWCNARKEAIGFYEKLGFEKASDEFMVEKIGPHYLMTKNIS